ncbi:DNA cytosine methyltransferase [Paraburkholderia sp. WSM4175]|uniref:DNA cytosine methyltransferase n=1 Tax=Paraburkholderia sp. WSM4175 TaxID=2991072 RepID=UPI003D1CA020
MAEIDRLARHGKVVVSTFSGGGGSCLGYRIAGYRVLWANEFIKAARETYAANFPDTVIDPRDIRQVQPDDILAATGRAVGEIDLFDGSPPCAAFSVSGKGDAGWGETKLYSDGAHQRVDDLFFEYTRLLAGLQPKVFIAENVKGLVRGKAKGYFKLILAALADCGYTVEARVINAAFLGVPQARERLIFVGVRRDLNLSPAFPKPLPYVYTVRDALGGLDTAAPVEQNAWLGGYQTGAEWRRLRPGQGSAKYLNLIRAHFDAPCPTVIAVSGKVSTACVTHPTECRKFTAAEVRRLCSFPDDFILTGNYQRQIERMGRAVPPLMMSAIASTVYAEILSKVQS